jgi:N-acetyl sugar amidotransferase
MKSMKREPGSPPFPQFRYCVRCCMPETNEGMEFDELGICKACRASEEKMRIDWRAKGEQLRQILEDARREAGDNYDCMVPISGGKDSAFQLHILTKVYGCNPLAVTFSHNWFSEVGWSNLWNVVEKLDVDHIMYTPKRGLVNRLARKSLPLIGDSCWHCHAGVMAFPLQIAVKFGIKLIIWGESPADFSGRDTYFDQSYAMKSAVDIADIFMRGSVRQGPDAMVGGSIAKNEMRMFYPPSREELVTSGIKAIYLGDYVFWDQERQTEFLVKEYGWKEDKVEGTYKRYKSVECRMPGVHDFAKYIKRGFGRASDFAAQDIRAGLMTREEAFDIASKIDAERPEILDYYLRITGYTEEEFHEILRAQRQGKAKLLP